MATVPRISTCDKPGLTFTQALAQAETQALTTLDQALHKRLAAAVALVKGGTVLQADDGRTWQVESRSEPGQQHAVNGTCDCADAQYRAPRGLCAHRLAVYLARRTVALMAAPPAPIVPQEVLDDDGWPPEEDVLDRTPGTVVPGPPAAPVPIALGPAIERSAEVGLLMAALARAQARMSNPVHDSTNPHFRNRYASLGGVRDAITPALAAEAIAVTQLPTTPEAGWIAVTTGLWHASGQYLCTTLRLPVPKNGSAQDYGSAMTYARRYSLQAICNVAGEEDDDAERLRTVHGGKAS